MDDPIFVIHETKIDRPKLSLTHNSLDCGDNSILLNSISNFIHRNLWRLGQYHLRSGSDRDRWATRLQDRAPSVVMNSCYRRCQSRLQNLCFIDALGRGDAIEGEADEKSDRIGGGEGNSSTKRTTPRTNNHGRLNQRVRLIIAAVTVGSLRQELQPACNFPDHLPRRTQVLLRREHIAQTNSHHRSAAHFRLRKISAPRCIDSLHDLAVQHVDLVRH